MRSYEASYRVRTNASGMNHGTGGSPDSGPLSGPGTGTRCRALPVRTVPTPSGRPAMYFLEAVL